MEKQRSWMRAEILTNTSGTPMKIHLPLPSHKKVYTQSPSPDANGCTATAGSTLTQLPTDLVFIQTEACSPQDTGTVELLLTNQHGCDSVVVIHTALAAPPTTSVSFAACTGTFVEFDGAPDCCRSDPTILPIPLSMAAIR